MEFDDPQVYGEDVDGRAIGSRNVRTVSTREHCEKKGRKRMRCDDYQYRR
jgi:hypothetical protein